MTRSPAPHGPPQMVMLIRHAEKPSDTPGAHGVSPRGNHDSHSLTVNGWIRAGALVELFAPGRGEPPDGLHRPEHIYGSAERGHSKRSVETVTPLAARLGLTVDTRYGEGDERELARELRRRPGVSLVCWHHGSMSAVGRHLGDLTPAPPAYWPEDRYDIVWTFTHGGAGEWAFVQVPQMLLPGDLTYPIAV